MSALLAPQAIPQPQVRPQVRTAAVRVVTTQPTVLALVLSASAKFLAVAWVANYACSVAGNAYLEQQRVRTQEAVHRLHFAQQQVAALNLEIGKLTADGDVRRYGNDNGLASDPAFQPSGN
ncbi:MAG: hypothetical protein JSS72_11850 [Armatimonadetes bacterium]|nr:hypothetical protein [Armatimonadota bacterium]